MATLIPAKMKQMGFDKNYKLLDAVDVELKDGTDVQEFVDNFEESLVDMVKFKDKNYGKPGQFAISNGDGTVSFQASASEEDPDLIAQDGTKFRFGVDEYGNFGYIITSESGEEVVIPFKSGGDDGNIVTSYKILWQNHTFESLAGEYYVSNDNVIGLYLDKTIDD